MSKLRQIWYDLRSSFWFVPALMILGSIALAIGLIEVDTHIDREVLSEFPRLFGASASGSRGLLGTIAGSMITVAGVVFSITLVALSLASSQYTSRVLRNFMRDPANQTVLGVFVGIFAYCLVVLRTIRGEGDLVFVPSLAVLFGLILGFVGIGFLIFFIHHISKTIQAVEIIAAVFEQTTATIDFRFPDELEGNDDDRVESDDADDDCANRTSEDERATDLPGQRWHSVAATRTGYLQQIDVEALLTLADERKMVVRLDHSVGGFIIEGTPLMSVRVEDSLNDEDLGRIAATYTVGRLRTIEQDVAYGIRQLVDMAMKALSPGVNDTTTAIMCVHHLTAILSQLANRRIESRYRGEGGAVRVMTHGPTFAGLMSEAFDQVRQNAKGNSAVLECMMKALAILAGETTSAERRRLLFRHAEAVREVTERSIDREEDRLPTEIWWERLVATLDAEGDEVPDSM